MALRQYHIAMVALQNPDPTGRIRNANLAVADGHQPEHELIEQPRVSYGAGHSRDRLLPGNAVITQQ